MRFFLGLGSKAKRFFLSSPAKEKAVDGENPVVGFDFKSKPVVGQGVGYSEFGSKEEIFFDSRAWIDSDCEDDFYSVNGDFTPSRGSTPNYQFTPGRTQLNKSLYLSNSLETKSEHSPTEGKKKLFDLLKESFNGENPEDEQNSETNEKLYNGLKLNNNQPPRSSEGSPYRSGTNSVSSNETTPNSDAKHRKDRTGRASHCCFPGLVPNCRKQKMSPVH